MKKIIWALVISLLALTSCQSKMVLAESGTFPVTINSAESESPDPANLTDNLFDNDPQTLWQTTPDSAGEAKLQIKLEKAVFLDYLYLSGVLESKQTVSIEYDAPDGIWQPLIGCQKIPLKNGRIDLSLSCVKADTLRLRLVGQVKNQALGAIGEIKVYGHQSTGLIRLRSQITTSGNSERNPAEFLNDHNTSTIRKLQPESITLQLEQASVIKKIKLYLQKGQAVFNFAAWVDGKEKPFGAKLDLTSVNNGWYTIDVPELTTDKIQININDVSGQTAGIGEIEVWGETTSDDNKTIPLGDSFAGIRELGLDLADHDAGDELNLWLVLPTVTPDWKPRVNINGTNLAVSLITMNCNGVTLGKVNCDGNLLRKGHNVIVADFGVVTVANAALSVSSDSGCLKVKALAQPTGTITGLTDGMNFSELSGLPSNTFELQLESAACVDNLKLYGAEKVDLNQANLWIWQNETWDMVSPAQRKIDGGTIAISGGTIPTNKLKITLPVLGLLSEVKVFGSKTVQAAPQITLTQPGEGSLNIGNIVQFEGYVDNSDASVTLNGTPIQLQGNFFSCPVLVNGNEPTFPVVINAVDPQGRKGTLVKDFAVNKSPSAALPALQCELPECSYIADSKVTVKGTALHANEVTVNSATANLQSGTGVFSQETNLDEGENKVVITAKSASGALVNVERRIVRDTQPPVLLISDTLKEGSKVTISGTCNDASPVELTINKQKVDVSANSFSYTTELAMGANLFKITVKDAVGNETSEEVTVTQEKPLLFASSSNDDESKSIPPPPEVDFSDMAAKYEAPIANTNQAITPFGAWFNNNTEWVSPTSGSLMITAKDLVLPGRDGFDLEFIRSYSSEKAQSDLIPSINKPKEQVDSFGVGWVVNIPWISDGQLVLPNGQNIKFSNMVLLSQNKYEYHEGVHFVLEYNPNSMGYTLTMSDGIKYLFDNTGKATDKISPNGKNSIHFTYSGSEIAEITDSLGRKVKFIYKRTVGTKRLIQSIEANGRVIEYDYDDHGLLKWVSAPLNRKTEYKYTCFAGKQIGYKYRFDKKMLEVIHGHGPEKGEINSYDLYLLESITYPTGSASTYTYYNNTFSQNYDWDYLGYFRYRNEKFPVKEQTIGSKHISFSYQMNPQSGGIDTKSNGLAEWVSNCDFDPKNKYILSTTMVETGGKTVKYNLQHVVKNSGNYSPTPYPTSGDYVGPVIESSQVSYDNKDFESVNYQYKWNILMTTLEQHLRGTKEIYRITSDYDAWGNLTVQSDSRTGLQKTVKYFDHATVKNLPEKVTVTNQNPVTKNSSQVATTYTYHPDYLKPATVTVDTGTKNILTGFTYYDNGNLWTKNYPNGLVEVMEYDKAYNAFPAKRTFQGLKDADGKAIADITNQYGYNYYGLKQWAMDGRGYVTYYVYDDLNRIKYVYLPDDDDTTFVIPSQEPTGNPYREYKYNDTANTCDFWNENRQRTLYQFDGLGRLTKETKYNNSRYGAKESNIIYHYNDQGQIDCVTDPNNHITNYKYDGLGRLERVTYPSETADEVYAKLDYDDATNTVTVQQENGNIVIHKKDWSNRLVTATQQAVYDGGSDTYQWSFQYDSMGNKVQQTNPLSEITDYTFDPLGHLERVQLPADNLVTPGSTSKEIIIYPGKLQPTTVCEYDEMGNKKSETDANGNLTEYEYDVLGRLLSAKSTVKKPDLTTKSGKTEAVVTKYYYDAGGNKITTIDPNSHAWQCTYSARGFLLSEATPDGNVTQYGYDPLGNKIAVIDPRNVTKAPKIWYSLSGDELTLSDSRSDKSFTTWYLYDDYNRLYRTVMPDSTPPSNPFAANPEYDNPYTEIWYDLAGNKESERDTTGQLTKYTYYPRNWLKTVSGPGEKQSYVYDAAGNQTGVRIWSDIAGDISYSITKQYDSLGRLRQVTHPQSKEEYTYDPFGDRLTMKDGNGNLTEYKYNNFGWQTAEIDPLKNTTTYRYDPNGNKVATITAKNLCSINRYDEQNRVVESIDSLGVSTLYNYDLNGNLSEKSDPRKTSWEYIYNDNNTLKQLNLTGADNSTYTINYTYDKAGNRLTVSDTGKIKNSIVYNDQIPDPSNRINVVERQFDGKSYRMEYEYNPAGQLKAVKYPEATEKINYQYNPSGQLTEIKGFTQPGGITYYDDGLVKNITQANNVNTQYTYDADRQLRNLNVTQEKNSLLKLDYAYDQAGNITSENDQVSQRQTTYKYYPNNWLQSETTKGKFEQEAQGAPGYVQQDHHTDKLLDYTPIGVINLDYAACSVGLDFGGDYIPAVKKIQLVPDKDHQTHRVVARGLNVYYSANTTNFTLVPKTDWTFAKDADGVITITLKTPIQARYLKIHSLYNDTDPNGNPVNKATFLNDLAKMLRVYEEIDGTKNEEYQYDSAGNRKQRTVTLVNTKTNRSYYYPGSDRLLTDERYGYIYDAAGNLVEKGNKFAVNNDKVVILSKSGTGVEYWEYVYDLMNRLVEVRKNQEIVVQYGYDPEGLRVVKSIPKGETTHYVFEGTEPVFEKQIKSGKIKSYIYALGKHLARVDGAIGDATAKVYYYHTDHIGSIRKITDQQGQEVWNADYAAFGTREYGKGSIDELHSFTGKELDPDTGLYYYNARWYDSESGRFISEDPAQDPNNPNLYSYCGNNPVMRIDPSGKSFIVGALLSWVFNAACKGVEAYNNGGDFWDGFIDGLFINPSVSVSGHWDSNGNIVFGERPETTGGVCDYEGNSIRGGNPGDTYNQAEDLIEKSLRENNPLMASLHGAWRARFPILVSANSNVDDVTVLKSLGIKINADDAVINRMISYDGNGVVTTKYSIIAHDEMAACMLAGDPPEKTQTGKNRFSGSYSLNTNSSIIDLEVEIKSTGAVKVDAYVGFENISIIKPYGYLSGKCADHYMVGLRDTLGRSDIHRIYRRYIWDTHITKDNALLRVGAAWTPRDETVSNWAGYDEIYVNMDLSQYIK